ncbi:MAG: SRPBCC family protein [Proteobacteria bacterium]|nr:SRPBCC family protein [Pseudomonadota bacterium]
MQKLLYAISGFIILLVIVGLALPRHALVHSTVRIDAPPATIFALINDFHRISLWSPWINSDPNARIVFSGPERGVDATITWDGTIIGTGAQVITASQPYQYIATTINPGEPSEARSWFDLKAADGTTIITWSFETDYGYNLVGRYFALILKGVVQRDYDVGLANLRDLAESLPGADFSDIEIERITVEPMQIAYRSASSIPEPSAISEAMGEAYFEILNFIDTHRLQEAGAPLSITRSFSGSQLLFDAAIPVRSVSEATPTNGVTVNVGYTYGGTVIRVKHVGSYRTLSETHVKIAAYLAALGIKRNGDAWESYVSDPTKVAEADLLTYVYYPIR